MANHGTLLTAKNLKKFSGTVVLNIPEIDNELAGDFGNNGDAVSLILKTAFTRANFEEALVKLGKVAEPKPQPAPLPMFIVIDGDLNPNVPSGLYLTGDGTEHRKMGKITLEKREDGKLYANGVEVVRYLSPNQQNGKSIQGHKLRKELKDVQVLNACIMDALLANPQLILDEWKTGYTYFLGTTFRDAGGDLVRRVPVLERRSVALALQLARPRLALRQPGRGARKLVLGIWGSYRFLILCPLALRISFCPAHDSISLGVLARFFLCNVIK